MAVKPTKERERQTEMDGARSTGPRLHSRHTQCRSIPAVPPRALSQRAPFFWFLLPALIGYGILFVYPTIRAFYLSLFNWTGSVHWGNPSG